MKKLVVLIPEGNFIDYFVYSDEQKSPPDIDENCNMIWKGRIKFSEALSSGDNIGRIIKRYKPEAVAIRLLYGGEEFCKAELYNRDVLKKLEKLITQSPFHVLQVIRLIQSIERNVPTPDIFLFSETAFFKNLPLRERTYALDQNAEEDAGESLGEARRFGYHGLFHHAALMKAAQQDRNARKILSICLEPVPEVVAIYDGKPIMASSGTTPLEGLPGNTTCGEIDPSIILFLEQEKGWGPEKINDVLTRKSGITAIAGQRITIDNLFNDESAYRNARQLFQYRVLRTCGAAVGLMDGVDVVIFSGRYRHAVTGLSEWLVPKLVKPSVEAIFPRAIQVRKPLDQIIAQSTFRLIHLLCETEES